MMPGLPESTTIRPWLQRRRQLLIRILLAPLFIGFCYLFDWYWLRVFTAVTVLKISPLLGIPINRAAADVLASGSAHIRFVVSCTLIDAFFGAMPFLWRTSMGLSRNAVRLAAQWVVVCSANLARLELSLLVLRLGTPWWLAHDVTLGATYFLLFMCFAHNLKAAASEAEVAFRERIRG